MTPTEFTFWLDGFLTANPHIKSLNEEQTKRLKDKLSTVFVKITPTLYPTKESPIKESSVNTRTYCSNINELDCSSESLIFKFNPNDQPITC